MEDDIAKCAFADCFVADAWYDCMLARVSYRSEPLSGYSVAVWGGNFALRVVLAKFVLKLF